MQAFLAQADIALQSALANASHGKAALHQALEALNAPIYATDATGIVTFYTEACVGFAGRLPAVGKDQWCVTWKLYTEAGEDLPHAKCPMALALATGRQVRGVFAVAERPDGTRVTFAPFPTPIFDEDGELVGAINLLLDISDVRQISVLKAQAQKCRRLLADIGDASTKDSLSRLAQECELQADEIESRLPPSLR